MTGLGVQTIPELYGCLLGWIQYQHGWTWLVKTGCVFLPFLSVLITQGVTYYLAHGAEGASISLRQISLRFVTHLFVISIACVPCVPLSPHQITLSHEASTTSPRPGQTHTTYDAVFYTHRQNNPRVPLWWYGVMATAEGITAVLRQAVGQVMDLRGLITTVNLTTIQSAALRTQLTQFYGQCYLPARAHYLNAQKTGFSDPDTTSLTASLTRCAPNDTEWPGSHRFNTVPGYYDQLRAHQSIHGFPFDPAIDWMDNQLAEKPHWGRPLCVDWWNDADVGLKHQLLRQLPAKTQTALQKEAAQDDCLIDQVLIQLLTPVGYAPANTLVSEHSYGHVMMTVGMFFHAITSYPKLYAIEQAAPMMRALFLLLFYTFLPFGLVFSGIDYVV